jgi:hypothetical protein
MNAAMSAGAEVGGHANPKVRAARSAMASDSATTAGRTSRGTGPAYDQRSVRPRRAAVGGAHQPLTTAHDAVGTPWPPRDLGMLSAIGSHPEVERDDLNLRSSPGGCHRGSLPVRPGTTG